MPENNCFHDCFGRQFDINSVVREITEFLKADPNRQYKIIIGSDSERLMTNEADFVTAIVVYRIGAGGRYFWRRLKAGKFFNIRDRIIKEVLLSLDAAKELLTILEKEKTGADWSFEIHADVGENGPSKALIQEVVGIIRANNFEAKTKPESYAASNVADRHVIPYID